MEETKNPIGRPTDYKPEYCEMVDDYLAKTGKNQMHLPKIESFAIFLGVVKKTLYNWADKYPAFLHALDKIMVRQAEQLIDDGIYGGKEVNAVIVKLLLQNNHGMREKSDTDITSGGDKISVSFHSSLKQDEGSISLPTSQESNKDS